MLNKKIKFKNKIIFTILGSVVLFGILNSHNLYAAQISFNYSSYTMIAGSTKEFNVLNATRAGNWTVYTEKNNNVISIQKRTSRIECKALNYGSARLCVRDGITGVVGICNIFVIPPMTDLSITRC